MRRRPGTTSQRRAITTSRGFINRHRVITSRRHAMTIGRIRAAVGTAMAEAVGMGAIVAIGTMTTAVVDATTVDEVTTAAAAITMAGVAVGNLS